MVTILSFVILLIVICSRILIRIGRAELNNYISTPYLWLCAIGAVLVYDNKLPKFLDDERKHPIRFEILINFIMCNTFLPRYTFYNSAIAMIPPFLVGSYYSAMS